MNKETVAKDGLGGHVVVVEDDDDLREDLVEYLSDRGFEVQGARDARELDQILDRSPVDLLILDIILPDEDGFSIAKRMRGRDNLGILMLTCRSAAEDQVIGLQAGADAYLVKEADLSVIEATARSILRRVKRADGLEEPEIPENPVGNTEAWCLDMLGRTITTPDGRCIKLTGKELAFMAPLMRHPGIPVERRDLTIDMGSPDTEQNRRNLDAHARRLRRKTEEETGLALPLDSIYGGGYVFTGSARVIMPDAR